MKKLFNFKIAPLTGNCPEGSVVLTSGFFFLVGLNFFIYESTN